MQEKYIRRLFHGILLFAVSTTLLAIFQDTNGNFTFESTFLLTVIWAISPIACLYLVRVILERLYSITNMSIFLLVVSLMMLLVTFMYFENGVRRSSTDALKYLFAPFFLHILWFVSFEIAIIWTLLAKLVKKLQQKSVSKKHID